MSMPMQVASLFGVLNLRDNMTGGLERASGTIDEFGAGVGAVTGQVQNLGTVMLGAGAAGTAAVAGFAGAATNQFATLERGMNEVFTLLPGITNDAMEWMTSDVELFAERFGVLPNQVVPALYQSLSAGVPQDNVFDFLETAQMAAVGGVTQLETAVDGISSVVNAYGDDVINASEASDLMFTTVRLGKTNFEELSSSLFNVIPTASALGVSFGDVSAGMATITAQGTPTSVATTQMRQLFVELGDTASDVGGTFEQVAGQSFKDFIAEGNTVGDALTVLQDYAREAGLDINQLFGSVEAGNAALALTGPNAERFANNIEEMGNATGATEAAFERMDQGISRSMDNLAASFQVFLGNAGDLFAPVLGPAIDVMTNFFGIINAGLDSGETLSDWITHLPEPLQGLGRWVGRAAADFRDFMLGMESTILTINDLMSSGLTPMQAILQGLGMPTDEVNMLARRFYDVRDAVMGVIDPVIGFIQQHVEMRDVLIAGAIAIGSVVVPAIVSMVAPIAGTVALLVGGVALLRNAWESNFMGIRDVVGNVAGWVTGTALPAIVDFVTSTVLPGMQRFGDWLGGVWQQVQPGLSNLWEWFTQTALPGVLDFVTGTALPAVQDFFNWIGGVWDDISPALNEVFGWFTQTALPDIRTFLTDTVFPQVRDFFNFIGGVWAAVSPALLDFAGWFLDDALPSIWTLIRDNVSPTVRDFIGLIGDIWERVSGPLESVRGWFLDTGLPAIVNFLNGAAKTAIDGFIGTLRTMWDWAGRAVSAVRDLIGVQSEMSGMDYMSDSSNYLSPPPGLASGGNMQAGQTYLVGEEGPELVTPNSSAYVNDADTTKTVMNNQSYGDIYVYQQPGESGEALAERIVQVRRNRGIG